VIRILAVVASCCLWWSGLLAHAGPIMVLDNGPIPTNGLIEDSGSLDLTGFNGLDRAKQAAGEHGQQGRDSAAFHHATSSAQMGARRQFGAAILQLCLCPNPPHSCCLGQGWSASGSLVSGKAIHIRIMNKGST